MATSKEYPNKEEVYSDEDRKLIVSLLDEYAQKLMNICEKIDHQIDKSQRFFLLVFVFTSGVFTLLFSSNDLGLTLLFFVLLVLVLGWIIIWYSTENNIIKTRC